MKIVHEWNGHLEIFSCPQAIEFQATLRYFTENSRRVLLFTGLYHLKQGVWSYFAGGVVKLHQNLACILDGHVFDHV